MITHNFAVRMTFVLLAGFAVLCADRQEVFARIKIHPFSSTSAILPPRRNLFHLQSGAAHPMDILSPQTAAI